MSFKIGYLVLFLLLMKAKDAWCDPVTLGIVFAAISGAATTAAPFLAAGAAGFGLSAMLGGNKNDTQGQSAYTPAPANPGAATSVESVEAQAAQRRLARMSKYFTSPTGVLETPTGSSGVF